MTLTRDDINRGYKDPRWGGYGYLKAREDATSPNRRSAADLALLRLANRRGWTYETLFEDVLNSQPGRIYGEWANEEHRSDAQLDTLLEAMEVHVGVTPGARSGFDFMGPNKLGKQAREEASSAERKFERNRRLEQEVAEIARRDADEARIDAMIRYGRTRRRGFNLFARSERSRYRRHAA